MEHVQSPPPSDQKMTAKTRNSTNLNLQSSSRDERSGRKAAVVVSDQAQSQHVGPLAKPNTNARHSTKGISALIQLNNDSFEYNEMSVCHQRLREASRISKESSAERRPKKKKPKAKIGQTPIVIQNSAFYNIDDTRRVFYRGFHSVSGVIYLVEMSHNGKRAFVILFPNFENSEKFIFDSVPLKVFTKLFRETR